MTHVSLFLASNLFHIRKYLVSHRQPPGPWSKEVHFFNRWPLPPADEFLKCFPNSEQPDWSLQNQLALVDATPEYLFNSVAAPRVKAIVPQAKFVVILRVCFACLTLPS